VVHVARGYTEGAGTPTALAGYHYPTIHEEAARVIREHSSHPEDIRNVAFAGLELDGVTRAIDVGCGFGLMSEALALRCSRDAFILGIDAEDSNRDLFLDRLQRTGRQGQFVQMVVEDSLPYGDGLFEAAVCSYSLYFFPRIVPDLARVLAPDGVLVAVTHTEESCRKLARLLNLVEDASPLVRLVAQFSGERGRGLLLEYFEEVEAIEYRNALRFGQGTLEPLFSYLRFKLPFMLETDEVGPGGVRELVEAHLAENRLQLMRRAEVLVPKDDVIFRCRRPRRGGAAGSPCGARGAAPPPGTGVQARAADRPGEAGHSCR